MGSIHPGRIFNNEISTHELKPIIFLMVFGFLSGNWLYLVGGVFGIIGASQEANAKEEKKEEPKE